jgi:DNA repair photolyase
MEFIRAKRIVYPVKNGWFGVTHNMNIYNGCNQGCIYCDSRSSCYQIKDFDKVKPKQDAPRIIEENLKNARQPYMIGMGGMSDPYNHLEEKLQYTRKALQSILKYGHGVFIITKNIRVLRDIDLLQEINKKSPVIIGITITTFDDRLQKRIERNVSLSSQRFDAIKQLRQAGLYAGIMMMPILPFINDTQENIANIVTKAHDIDANFIYPSFGVTLRDNQRDYYFHKIKEDLTKKYIDTYQEKYYCESLNKTNLSKEFKTLCAKYGIIYTMNDIIKQGDLNVRHQQVSFTL